MKDHKDFDVIIIGGSYSGLAAAMALGRAIRKVLIIDNGKPCNRQTPHSHNFLTQDRKTPKEISSLGKQQVAMYDTVEFLDDLATKGAKTENSFDIHTSSKKIFSAKKLIFATGIRDIMPSIEGFTECWGISVLHCPYCHGYEIRNEPTGILGNGDYGFDFSKMISNWTKDLTLFTNGMSTLTNEQRSKIEKHNVKIIEKKIERLKHENGSLQSIIFTDETTAHLKALYTKPTFEQHCTIPAELECELTDEGYIKIDASHKTTVQNIYACGDNTTRMRTVANAIAMGTATGMNVNKEMIEESF